MFSENPLNPLTNPYFCATIPVFDIGMSPSGKAQDFDSCIRWFEPSHPSQQKSTLRRAFLLAGMAIRFSPVAVRRAGSPQERSLFGFVLQVQTQNAFAPLSIRENFFLRNFHYFLVCPLANGWQGAFRRFRLRRKSEASLRAILWMAFFVLGWDGCSARAGHRR